LMMLKIACVYRYKIIVFPLLANTLENGVFV